MKLALVFCTVLLTACTLSVNDKNPKAVSLFGSAGTANANISNGSLVLTGTNLDRVTAMELTQKGGPNAQLGPFTTQTRTMLTAVLPAVLRLPGMLLLSTPAGAAQVALAALDTLTVDGDLHVDGNANVVGNATVAGTTNVGLEKVQANCASGTGFCSVSCPTNKKVVSGGCFTNTSGAGFSANYPSSDNQWTCRPTAAAAVEAYVICGRTEIVY